jgi:hypothetical protein
MPAPRRSASPVTEELGMTMTTQPASTPEPAEPLWLTATLRPVGVLTGAAIDRLADELAAVAVGANIVVVNLVAAEVPDPNGLAEALRRPGQLLTGPDKCLLIVGAGKDLLAALDRCGGEIAAIDAGPDADLPAAARALAAA